MNKPNQYVYPAVIQDVIDADTFTLTVDLGFHIQKDLIENPVRLAGIDAPEIDTEAGVEAYNFVKAKIQGRRVTIKSIKTDYYGRWLVRLWPDDDQEELTIQLLREGHYKTDDEYSVNAEFMPDNFIDLNKASKVELQWLPEIGPATVDQIIANRPFSKTIDLMEVHGIGNITYDRLSRLIDVS